MCVHACMYICMYVCIYLHMCTLYVCVPGTHGGQMKVSDHCAPHVDAEN